MFSVPITNKESDYIVCGSIRGDVLDTRAGSKRERCKKHEAVAIAADGLKDENMFLVIS